MKSVNHILTRGFSDVLTVLVLEFVDLILVLLDVTFVCSYRSLSDKRTTV